MKYNLQALIDKPDGYKREDFIFFWSGRKGKKVTKNCFSQWYPSEFVVDGVAYYFAEQYMMAKKALLFKDYDTLSKILSSNDPKVIKQLGREVRNFDPNVWNQHKYEIVVEGNMAKFSQNPELKKFLESTGHKILVEASPYDRIWGIGLKDTSELVADPSKWRGQNLLGFALMEVRDNLI